MTDQIQQPTINLEIEAAHYLWWTSNSSIKNIQPSPRLSTAKIQVIAIARERRIPKQRPLKQCGTDKYGPTKKYGRIKGAKRSRLRQGEKKKQEWNHIHGTRSNCHLRSLMDHRSWQASWHILIPAQVLQRQGTFTEAAVHPDIACSTSPVWPIPFKDVMNPHSEGCHWKRPPDGISL